MDNFYRQTPIPTRPTRDPFADLLSEVETAIKQQHLKDEIRVEKLIETIIQTTTREHLFKIAKTEKLHWTFTKTKKDTQLSLHSLMEKYPTWKWSLIRLKTKIINDIRDKYEIPRLTGEEQKREKQEIQLYSATVNELKTKFGLSPISRTLRKNDLIRHIITTAHKRPRERSLSVAQSRKKR